MLKKDWDGRTGGGNGGQSSLVRMLRRIDVRVLYCVLPFAVCYYLVFARKRARTIYSYLRKRQGMNVFRSLTGTWNNHIIFGKNLLDRFYVFAGNKDKFHISRQADETVRGLLAAKGPLVAVSAHLGNFEISAYICGWLDRQMKVIAYGEETEMIQQYRDISMGENNIGIIPVKDDMSHILGIAEQLSSGGSIILTGDRFLSGKRVVKCSFLGSEAGFPSGIYYLADKYRATVAAIFIVRGRRNFEYDVIVEPIEIDSAIKGRDARAAAYTSEYVRVLESVVRRYPLQWFNYYDFWKND